MTSGSGKLVPGDWVEIRSKEEILRTLDGRGELDSLPFMPEMLQYCGQRFQVFKSAHKKCDPPNGLQARRMTQAVHLDEVRCDGAAHGGCQAGCLIFWKESWLKRATEGDAGTPAAGSESATAPTMLSVTGCSEQDVFAAACESGGSAPPEERVYACQSTRLHAATTPLRWWDQRQYLEDLVSGNVRVSQLLASALYSAYHLVAESGIGLGALMRWTYDTVQRIRGGPPYPLRPGKIPDGMRTPEGKLGLRPGELVRVRSYPEILETLDRNWANRGLYFDSEQVPFCGGTYRVLRRVERIINEKTGKLIRMKTDAIVLNGVACQSRYSKCRRFCPRSIYAYWREIWLERLQ
jgi:hypothetical protein